MSDAFSNYIVHYSRGEPFKSISSADPDRVQDILLKLDENNAWGLNRFSDPEYFPRRIEVEKKIRQQFIGKGGRPQLEYPIYFFLGRNARFEEHKKNVGYRINLDVLPPGTVSFTYGDSMFCLNEDYRQRLGGEYLSEYCSHVYLMEELTDLISEIGQRKNALHVECQLWINPTHGMFNKIESDERND
jgi:hypothetical protein